MSYYKFLIIFCSFFLLFSCSKLDREKKVNKEELLSSDYRIFQGTVAWELAKAVWDGDKEKIDIEIKKSPELLNFQDLKYGQTLLHLSVFNNNKEGFDELLTLGANPNISNRINCGTPLTTATLSFEDRTYYVKELIKHKANINAIECDDDNDSQSTVRNSLMNAVFEGDFELVKLLVQNGADVNFDTGKEMGNALGIAITGNRYDIALYLLQNNADCSKVLYSIELDNGEKKIYFKNLSEEDPDFKSSSEYLEIKELVKKKGCL